MRDIVPVVSIIMIFAIPIVAIVCYYVHSAWKAWVDAGVKREMVARGYTAQEIVAVLEAGKTSDGASKLPDVPPAKPVKQPAYNV